jgi:RHS repeat-associated protein
MKKLFTYLSLLLCSPGAFAQSTITLSTARTTGGAELACQSITLKPGFSFKATTTASLTLTVNPTTCDPFAGQASSASSNQNYIQTRTYTTEDGSRYMEAIQYFDGLGRPTQTVQRGITPNAADLVTLQEYDAFGRESNSWLPAVISGNNGAFVTPATVKTAAVSSNGNDQKPYSMPVYEASPLNRVLEQYGPGQDWHNNSKKVSTAYKTNISGDATLNCKLYIAGGTNQSPILNQTTNYATGRLYVTEVKDEDGNTSYEFKDKLGQVVLTRQMEGTTPHDTYYVYNALGNKCFVLPPKIQDEGITQAKLNELAYQYKYDHRNRCIAKKIPGCDWIYYVYDKADRLIFTQDGEQRSNGRNEWTFTIPDVFGRVVLTGICKNSLSYAANPLGNIVVRAEYPQAGTGLYMGYNITGVTLATGYRILSANYYDNYKYRNRTGFSNTALAYESSGVEAVYLKRYGVDGSVFEHKGLLTGTATAIFDNATTTNYLYSCMYYDNRGRLIQTKSTNHLTGGIEKEYIAYNFTGQPTQRKHIHSATGKNTQTEVYAYTYDHAGRLLKTTHQLTDGTTVKPLVTLAENTYDELGRLKTTKKNNQANLNTTYAYNIRSWTSKITNAHFNETLTYSYNGNISSMQWGQAGKTRKYSFTYDNLSRLKTAAYTGQSPTNFAASYTYDKHGNIKTLQRYGMTTASTYGIIDNLTAEYTGNQLKYISDAVNNFALNSSMDFKEYTEGTGTEYTYNANGAMNKDLNKGISQIQYNSLNLPQTVDIKNRTTEGRNEYTYSTSGQKLKAVQKWNPNYNSAPVIGSGINVSALTMSSTTDYAGNIIYENGNLKRILVDGGYYEGGNYYFYINDHLGNNRIVANAVASVVQSTQYYPFGMPFADATGANVQPYKYNNKELDGRNGLNWYDSDARPYNSPFPNTPTPDPHAENYYSWSPYAWVANNPMKYIDPNGMDTLYFDYQGQYSSDPRKGGNDVIYVTDKDGNIHMRNFGEGAFKEYGRGKGGENGYFYLSANNDGNSKSVFEFLADHTTVEWSNAMFMNEDKSLSNFITTSHEEGTERGLGFLYIDKDLDNAALLKSDHNHPIAPSTIPWAPSGTPDYDPRKAGLGDIGALSYDTNFAISKLRPIPVHRFYVPGKGYRRYNINSTFKHFKNMPNYYYEK